MQHTKRKRILISAFAISPNRGSEAGVGWNICTRLGKYHDVTVLYGSDYYRFTCSSAIPDYIKINGPIPGVKFYPIKAPPFSYACQFLHDHGLWAFYYLGYRAWQKAAYHEALKLHQQEPFDLAHQLNMIGYREPGYLWKLDLPFVWGPVGGTANVPLRFASILGVRESLFHFMRNTLNKYQLRFSKRVRMALNRTNGFMTATSETREAFLYKLGKDSILISETGTATRVSLPQKIFNYSLNRPLMLVWSGVHISLKALPLLLYALSRIPSSVAWQLDILGDGTLTMKWKTLAEKLGIAEYCKWHGWLNHDQAIQVMANSDVLIFTSLKETTPHVVMEALSIGIPVICLNHCGMADVIHSGCGIKIPITSLHEVIGRLAGAIKKIAENPYELQRLSSGTIKRAHEFSWDNNIDKILNVYETSMSHWDNKRNFIKE